MEKNGTRAQVYYQQWWWDEQYTPRYWVEVLLSHIQHLKDKTIRCPFDKEDSQFVKVLTENGFTVEQCTTFNRAATFPQNILLDGRESIGAIARKPTTKSHL